MSRNLFHRNHLEEFKVYLDAHTIPHRPGRGPYQVLQVQTRNGQWQCVFSRDHMPEHYTVAHPLERLVVQFIRDRKSKKEKSNV